MRLTIRQDDGEQFCVTGPLAELFLRLVAVQGAFNRYPTGAMELHWGNEHKKTDPYLRIPLSALEAETRTR